MASKSEFFDWYDKNFAEGDRKIQDLIDTLSQRGQIKANSDSAGRSLQEKNAARPKGTPSRAPGVKGPLAAGRGPLIPGKKASAKKPLGIDDPEIRARLNAAKAKREAAPTAAAPPKGVHYDQPPLVFRLFGHSSDPNEFTGEPNLGPRLSPQTKKGAPLPRYEMQAPRNPERERRLQELAPKGEGITRAGQPGARPVGFRGADNGGSNSSAVEDRKKRDQQAKDRYRVLNGAAPRKKSEAELQEDRETAARTWPRSYQPGGSASSLYASQVPKAGRTSGGRRSAKSVGSRVDKDNAVKRLGGKRPVNRGEI